MLMADHCGGTQTNSFFAWVDSSAFSNSLLGTADILLLLLGVHKVFYLESSHFILKNSIEIGLKSIIVDHWCTQNYSFLLLMDQGFIVIFVTYSIIYSQHLLLVTFHLIL